MKLAGKVALITGASRDIGEAAAHAFAAAGAAVALAARDVDALERIAKEVSAAGADTLVIPTDVLDEGAVQRMVQAVTDRFGALHVAFNNAGGTRDTGFTNTPLADLDTPTFDQIMGLNARGTFLSMKYEIPAMLAAGGGAIVNTSAISGLRAGFTGLTPLAAAKHAVGGMTKAAAWDYAAQGIRVNALAIGTVPPEHFLKTRPTEVIDWITSSVPMKRLGKPEEAAAAALWLCSDESSYITGTVVPVDAGIGA